MTDTTIKDTSDLLGFLASQAEARKDWFGFHQQRMTAISLAHDIAKYHADSLTPAQCAQFAIDLNEQLYQKIFKGTR